MTAPQRFVVRGVRRSGTHFVRCTAMRAYRDVDSVEVDDEPWPHGTFGARGTSVAIVREPYGWALSYHDYVNSVRETNGLDPIPRDERTSEEVRAWVERWASKARYWCVQAGYSPHRAVARYEPLLASRDAFLRLFDKVNLPDPGEFTPPLNRVNHHNRETREPFDAEYWLNREYVEELPPAFLAGTQRALAENIDIVEHLGYGKDAPEPREWVEQ